jgi:hypothetical protein
MLAAGLTLLLRTQYVVVPKFAIVPVSFDFAVVYLDRDRRLSTYGFRAIIKGRTFNV